MEVSKMELKILIKEFLSASNRVLRARYGIYATELSKFIRFLDTHDLISEYIKSCGDPEYDVAQEVDDVTHSCGSRIFLLGSTDEKEVANIYAVMRYMGENNISGRSYAFYGYSSSMKFQEKVNAFGNEFIRVLITHIENYLTRISIQMGLNDKTTVNINIENSTLTNAQVNVDSEGNSIATNQTTCDMEQLQMLISKLLNATTELSTEDRKTVEDCIETISTVVDENPKKGIIKMALKTLKGIAGTADFIAATTAIIQFVEPYL